MGYRTLEEFRKLTGIRTPTNVAEVYKIVRHPTPEEAAKQAEERAEYLRSPLTVHPTVERLMAEHPEWFKLAPPPARPWWESLYQLLFGGIIRYFEGSRAHMRLIRFAEQEIPRLEVWAKAARHYGEIKAAEEYEAEIRILMIRKNDAKRALYGGEEGPDYGPGP